MIVAILFAAAEVATPGSASAQALDLKGMNFIDGDTIKTIFAFLGMAVTGLFTYLKMKATMDKKLASKEESLRAEIANELRAKILNDPLHVEQSGYQAQMKNNEKDHTDLFNRLRVLEAEVAGIKATITAKFDGLSAQMMETREMVRSLYDKVCNGGKRK